MLDALPTAHHQLLGHGLAVPRCAPPERARVAIANHYSPAWPVGDGPRTGRRPRPSTPSSNWQFTDPILRGRYPDLGVGRPRTYATATSTSSPRPSTRSA